ALIPGVRYSEPLGFDPLQMCDPRGEVLRTPGLGSESLQQWRRTEICLSVEFRAALFQASRICFERELMFLRQALLLQKSKASRRPQVENCQDQDHQEHEEQSHPVQANEPCRVLGCFLLG